MMLNPGDTVCLRGDARAMTVVSKLDTRLMWVRLQDVDDAQMYAFRIQDLRLIAPAASSVAAYTTVPLIPLGRESDPIAA